MWNIEKRLAVSVFYRAKSHWGSGFAAVNAFSSGSSPASVKTKASLLAK
jgi:hypothetical protein